MPEQQSLQKARHTGDCHCGRIKFEFRCEPDQIVYRCNCSICERVGFLHLIIPERDFTLLTSWDEIAEYNFGSGIARHFFCKTCGVKPFYVPRSNPEGISIHYRCVDPSTFAEVSIEDFDGRNWEQHAASLSHLSD